MKRRLSLPPLFWQDCEDSDCDVGAVFATCGSRIIIEATPEQFAAIKSRAGFYVSPDGPDGPGLAGLKTSARATLRILTSEGF